MTRADKVRELRARRILARRGYRLQRVRRRDRLAFDYGRYRLFEIDNDHCAAEQLTLDGVEELIAAGQRLERQAKRSF